MEADALPTVLVYRNGELEANLVRVDLDWGRGERTDVEEVLFRYVPSLHFDGYLGVLGC